MLALAKRLLGSQWFLGGLGLVLAVVAGFAWLQTDRLSSARATVKAQGVTIGTLTARVADDTAAIEQRDRLIAEQNAEVEKIVHQQADDRAAYLRRLAQADKTASGLKAQAADIMKREVATTDELTRARAALQLVVETFGKES